tara:strand:- start:76 stop:693 length:618 start_codon:yes stop_codon:yes gene_type:complete
MLSDSPPERDLQWTDTGIIASHKFINKIWDLTSKFQKYIPNSSVDNTAFKNNLKVLINEVAINIESFQFNKSVAKIYEFMNYLNDSLSKNNLSHENFKWALNKLSLILQPFVPHISEEIWYNLGNETLCINQNWPVEKDVIEDIKINIAVQINGKTRSVIEVTSNVDKKSILKMAKEDKQIKKYLFDKDIKREIYVPGKILNFVL